MPETLPPGWKAYKTAEGRAYYYNTKTKVTQWTPPPSAAAAAAPPPKKPSVPAGRGNLLSASTCYFNFYIKCV